MLWEVVLTERAKRRLVEFELTRRRTLLTVVLAIAGVLLGLAVSCTQARRLPLGPLRPAPQHSPTWGSRAVAALTFASTGQRAGGCWHIRANFTRARPEVTADVTRGPPVTAGGRWAHASAGRGFERFVEEHVGPAAQAVGVGGTPDTTFHEVHDHLTPGPAA
jgi:hypothetical protein